MLLLLIPLLSCTSSRDLRPQAIIDGERLLRQGTAAYNDDRYTQATDRFTQALALYQSIDHQPGISSSYYNLIQTAIAVGNYSQAQAQLDRLQQLQQHGNATGPPYRLRLLAVTLLYHQQQYQQAIDTLRPLLPAFSDSHQLMDKSPQHLNGISSMARLMSVIQHQDHNLWLQRFQHAIDDFPQTGPRYRPLLLRLQAEQLAREGRLSSSLEHLQQALSLYKQRAHRRGIAATLQQMARVQLSLEQTGPAIELLQRALKIQRWMMNRNAAQQLIQQLISLHEELDNQPQLQYYRQQLKALQASSDNQP